MQDRCWVVWTGNRPDLEGLVSVRIIPPMFFPTLNIIFIHERGTLSHVCVDPSVVPGGLSVRPLRPSLWMERSLSIFSELRVGGEPLCAD